MSFDDSLSIDQWRKEGRAICQDAVGLEMYSNRFCNGSYIYYTEEQTRPATSEELESWRKKECQKKKEARQLLKQKKAEQEEHLQWLEKKLQAEQEKQERLDTFELNSKTEIKSYDILYGPNQGHISAVSYGKVLIVEGYVTAQNTGIQYVLAKINDINAINVTQIIFQVGSMPTDPYCMFGSIGLDGQITIGSSTQNTLYRFSAAVLIK